MSKAKFNAEKVQTAIIAALQKRAETAPNENQRDNFNTEIAQFSKPSMVACINELHALKYDFDALLSILPNADKSAKENFLAIYALQKVRKAFNAIGQGLKAFDGYTNSILHNLNHLQTISNINAQRSICNKIEFDELEQQVTLRRLHNCAPSTASTQASSTREMLRVLNICAVRKGAKGDSISFAETDIANKVQAMFNA